VGGRDDSRSSDSPSSFPRRTEPIYRPTVCPRCDGCRCCCRDSECWNRCRECFYRLAFEWLRNHHDAEDAAQEVYIRRWRHCHAHGDEHCCQCYWCRECSARSCECRCSFRCCRCCLYWRQCLRNVVGEIVRKRSRSGLQNQDLIDSLQAAEPEPLDNVTDDEMTTILQDVISQLPPVREQVVRLRYYENMTLAAIAEALGIGLTTVHTHLCRAHLAMKAMLHESYGLTWETLRFGQCVHCAHSPCPCCTHGCRYGCRPREKDCCCKHCPICSPRPRSERIADSLL
jgi:RNA polymerase sigma factor (sigma-70 family)